MDPHDVEKLRFAEAQELLFLCRQIALEDRLRLIREKVEALRAQHRDLELEWHDANERWACARADVVSLIAQLDAAVTR